jgi:septal ring factor EnvC (AmiA/AmiB activator)
MDTLSRLERRLRGELEHKVQKHLSGHSYSPWVQQKIDAIARVDVERSRPNSPTLEVWGGLASGISAFLRLTDYRTKLKLEFEEQCKKFAAKFREYLEEVPERIAAEVLEHTEDIISEIREHHHAKLADLKAEIEAKKKEDRELEEERAELNSRKDTFESLRGEADSLRTAVSVEKEKLENVLEISP